MNIAVGLLLYSLAVLLAGPPVLRALTTNGHVPRLGVAAWVTAIASVVASWLVAVAFLVFEVIGHWHYPQVFVASCLNRLHGVISGHAGLASQIMLVAIAAPMTAAAIRTAGFDIGDLDRFSYAPLRFYPSHAHILGRAEPSPTSQ